MEKTLSQEERIRRAEEVYNRRRYNDKIYYNNRYSYRNETENNKSIKYKITKKIILQIITCSIIYVLLYITLNSDYFFSDEVHNKINEFLSYDIEFSNLYNGFNSYWNSDNNIIKNIIESKNEDNGTNNEITNEISNTVNDNSVDDNTSTENNNTNSVGGAEETQNVSESKSQTELDIEYIKQNYNFIWPLNGVITSKYGTRQATDIVTANHYGIDIGGNTGDTIIAAIDGTVTTASLEGEYGEHLLITNGNVSTLYAHCSKLCVSEGESIKQGEKIAEVGSTGRATGPHLHFEIKVDDRTVDPETVL